MAQPEPHPDPPPGLHQLHLPLRSVAGPWIRSHAIEREPIFFGRTGTNRIDAPEAEYGVLYVAADAEGAFIETFGRRLGHRLLETHNFAARALTRVIQQRDLVLVDLTGPGLSLIGADSRLTSGAYQISQSWALALHNRPERVDGLLYRSRHDPSRLCAALFDRAADALSATLIGSLADDRHAGLLANLLSTYGYGLID